MRFRQRGFLLIAAVVIIALAGVMAVAIATLTSGSGQAGGEHDDSTRALYIAETGIERALNGLKTDTICSTPSPGTVVYNNVAAGNGTYTVTESLYSQVTAPTTLSVLVSNTATTIPLTSTAGYAPHGRVQIDLEKMDYAGISGNNLIGVQRGVAGTTAAAHAAAVSVYQHLCLIDSVGRVNNASRTLQATVALPRYTAFLDGASTNFTTAGTTIGTLTTNLPAGTNIVLAKVSFRNTAANGNPQIAAGNLRLVRGVTLASNQFVVDVGGGAAPGANAFPQETQYLLEQDANAPANSVYTVTAIANGNNNAFAEVKAFVINQAPNTSYQDGGTVALLNVQTTMLTHNSPVPAGDNLVIAVAQFDNTDNNTRNILAGNYRLNRTGLGTLTSNQFNMNLARQSRVNQGTAMMLVARDVGAPANPQYTVTAQANASNDVNGEVKIVVINGLTSAITDTGSVPVGTVATAIGTLATTFSAGENLVIASSQYENSVGAARNILAGNERIMFGGVAQVNSAYDINFCSSGTAECNDFDKGILWRQATAVQNPTFSLEALGNLAGINGETKLAALHFDYTFISEREIFR